MSCLSKKVLIRLAESLGIDNVEGLLDKSMKNLSSGKEASSVVLLKKDGSPIEGQGKGMDRAASKAVRVVQGYLKRRLRTEPLTYTLNQKVVKR